MLKGLQRLAVSGIWLEKMSQNEKTEELKI
jgi:hypothetical protein